MPSDRFRLTKEPADHPAHGRYEEWPAFSTTPQQDHYVDNRGIRILAPTDRRAQPWQGIVQANCHTKQIDASQLPDRSATVKEVREFLYLVLTNIESDDLGYAHPHAVCATLNQWYIDGKDLRALQLMHKETMDHICPDSYLTVYDEVYHISEDIRKQVGKHLRQTLIPLLVEETARESDIASTLNEKGKILWLPSRAKDRVRRGLAKVFPCMRKYEYLDGQAVNEKKEGMVC